MNHLAPNMPLITDDEFFAISRNLERHHAVFYKLWELGKPSFNERIQTAQVEFDKEGLPIAFVFNPDFWTQLTSYEREFIISHECLHVVLNHGLRINDSKTRNLANIALDIVVNHLLVNHFGYDRKQLSMNEDLCWVDTVFKGKKLLGTQLVNSDHPQSKDIPCDKSFEFYYLLLKQEVKDNINFQDLLDALKNLDDHSGLEGQNVDDILDILNDELSESEKEQIKDAINKHYEGNSPSENSPAGTGTGRWTFVSVGPVQHKRKWETVIKKWSRKFWKPEFREIEQWARLNRRFALCGTEFFLPSEMEIEHQNEEKDKIDVWFFQDTSGSCYHLKERFFKAALSLPPEKFNVRMFCFDTQVKETSIKSKRIYGGGGTSFSIIESSIQNIIRKEEAKYPEAVFIITDGWGNYVSPQYAERWHWFLSHNCINYIPKQSPKFMLKDFE